jgi:hypothetical protein
MSEAELQNIEHRVGTYVVLSFGPVDDGDGGWVDLSNATAVWRMAKSQYGTDILLSKDSGSSGGVTFEPEDYYGVTRYYVNVTLDPSDTINLQVCRPPAKWYHECLVTDDDDHPMVIASGNFDLQPSITTQTLNV